MAVERNFNKNNENCVEFLTGEHYAVCTYTNPKHKNVSGNYTRNVVMNSNTFMKTKMDQFARSSH